MNKDKNKKILIVDDEDSIREVLSATLRDEGYIVEVAQNGSVALQVMAQINPQIVFLDIWMPGLKDGIQVLKEAKSIYPNCDFVMMSGHGTIETAVTATRLGAWDFVEKPLSMDKILILIHNIISYQQERDEKKALLNRLKKNIALIGESSVMMDLKKKISSIATDSYSAVLLYGKDGTGKELAAQNIHYLSSRASQAFVAINCSSVPEELIEMEFFGYEQGAIPGADKSKKGKIEFADGGSLFLEEIEYLNSNFQLKFLTVLKEKRFKRVGGKDFIDVDIRLIASTKKNWNIETERYCLQEELCNLFQPESLLHIPALHERSEDVPSLTNHFSEHFCREGGYKPKTFTETTIDHMKKYFWPGNIRELKNFIERIYILTPSDTVDIHDLYFAGLDLNYRKKENESKSDTKSENKNECLNTNMSENKNDSGSSNSSATSRDSYSDIITFREARAKFEKEFLSRKIIENNGNISKTAESIGIERSHLHRKIKVYDIDIKNES